MPPRSCDGLFSTVLQNPDTFGTDTAAASRGIHASSLEVIDGLSHLARQSYRDALGIAGRARMVLESSNN